jgi:hypothetical protein
MVRRRRSGEKIYQRIDLKMGGGLTTDRIL